MIGTDLNLTLPSLSESMAVNIARCATAFSAIEDSLAQKATPAALDINAPLEMNGNSLTEVASVQFAGGNIQNTAGSLYYYNGDWFVVDPVGTIQLTDNGQLNAGSIGGIKGDYGGVNPAAVTYVDASGQYVFTEDTGIYADLVADDLILQGSAGSLTFSVDAALTGSRNINFKSLPNSGKSLLVYDAATSTLEDNAVTRTTNTPLFTDINLTGELKHGNRVFLLPGTAGQPSVAANVSRAQSPVILSATGAVTIFYDLPLRVGDRLKSVTFKYQGNGSADINPARVIITSDTMVDSIIGTTTVTDPGAGWAETTIDNTDTVLADGQSASLVITINAAGINIGNVRGTFDHP